ncbi:hypothetical protein GLA29479_2386 [Lysobacter antibioticus]|uniref:hypothetical protein n=1 Tax=Lysobacter antibioticus TaxID=84531 RepID=UPI000716FF12|nr:hypothetical protein [Lysobacter antibioticus]ALN63255.1 hypothetical protein GLA29479_2386 [Lysobacter antibioticus]
MSAIRITVFAGLLALAPLRSDAAEAVAAKQASPAQAQADCRRLLQLAQCLASVEMSSNSPPDEAYRGRWRRYPGNESEASVQRGRQHLESIVLSNGRHFSKASDDSQAGPNPTELGALLASTPVMWLGLLLGEHFELPLPGHDIDAVGENSWAYGVEKYRVQVKALGEGRYRIDVAKTATTGGEAPPEPAAQAGECSDAEAEAGRCEQPFVFSTAEDRAARLAELAPVGSGFTAIIGVQTPTQALPDSLSLSGWTSSDGKAYATLGDARRAAKPAAKE